MASDPEKLSTSKPSQKQTAKGKTEAVLVLIRTRLDQMIVQFGIGGLPPREQLSQILGISTKTIQRMIAKRRKDITALSAKNPTKRGRKSNLEREWTLLTDNEKSNKVQSALHRMDVQDREMVEDSKAISKNRSEYVRRTLAKNKDLLHVSSCLGDHAVEYSAEIRLKLALAQNELSQLTPTPIRNPNHPAFYEIIQIARYLSYGYEVRDAVLQFGPSTTLPNKTRNYRLRGEYLINLFDDQVGSNCDWQYCPRDFLMALRIAKDLGLPDYDMCQWLTTTFSINYQDAMEISLTEAKSKKIPLNTLRGFVIQESYETLFLRAKTYADSKPLDAKYRLQDSGLPQIT